MSNVELQYDSFTINVQMLHLHESPVVVAYLLNVQVTFAVNVRFQRTITSSDCDDTRYVLKTRLVLNFHLWNINIRLNHWRCNRWNGYEMKEVRQWTIYIYIYIYDNAAVVSLIEMTVHVAPAMYRTASFRAVVASSSLILISHFHKSSKLNSVSLLFPTSASCWFQLTYMVTCLGQL